jgi:hypothetical protein
VSICLDTGLDVIKIVKTVLSKLFQDLMIHWDLIVSDDDSLVGLFAFKLGHPWVLTDLFNGVSL